VSKVNVFVMVIGMEITAIKRNVQMIVMDRVNVIMEFAFALLVG
jgi:hypothetical protein